MWKKVAKLLISLFWPEIKKFLAKYIKEFLLWFEKKLKDTLARRTDENVQEAEANAAKADHSAAQATSSADIEKWTAVAAVWREVAEKFRRENESLQEEIAALRADGEAKGDESLKTLEFDDAFEVSNDDIRLIQNPPLLIERK